MMQHMADGIYVYYVQSCAEIMKPKVSDRNGDSEEWFNDDTWYLKHHDDQYCANHQSYLPC